MVRLKRSMRQERRELRALGCRVVNCTAAELRERVELAEMEQEARDMVELGAAYWDERLACCGE